MKAEDGNSRMVLYIQFDKKINKRNNDYEFGSKMQGNFYLERPKQD